MKILHTVSSYYPSIGGMQEVVRELSERLVRLGHDVTVMTSKHPRRQTQLLNGVKIVDFDLAGGLVQGFRGNDYDACLQFLKNSNFDIVVNFAAQQWATDIMIDKLSLIKGKKVFVPTGFSALYDPKFASYFSQMKNWLHHYDMNVFLSDDYRDVNFAKDCGVTKRILIPNGAGHEEFLVPSSTLPFHDHQNLILLVGNHTGQKGHVAAMDIIRLSKLKDLTLLIIGEENFCARCFLSCHLRAFFYNLLFKMKGVKKNILLRSLPRKEVLSAYHQAKLFLFPSKIECSPIVLFEAMASKTPFLSSQAGNASEIAQWSGSGEILPSFQVADNTYIHLKESVEHFDRLLSDEAKLSQMSEKGFLVWKERFTWDQIARKYEELYKSLLYIKE